MYKNRENCAVVKFLHYYYYLLNTKSEITLIFWKKSTYSGSKLQSQQNMQYIRKRSLHFTDYNSVAWLYRFFSPKKYIIKLSTTKNKVVKAEWMNGIRRGVEKCISYKHFNKYIEGSSAAAGDNKAIQSQMSVSLFRNL